MNLLHFEICNNEPLPTLRYYRYNSVNAKLRLLPTMGFKEKNGTLQTYYPVSGLMNEFVSTWPFERYRLIFLAINGCLHVCIDKFVPSKVEHDSIIEASFEREAMINISEPTTDFMYLGMFANFIRFKYKQANKVQIVSTWRSLQKAIFWDHWNQGDESSELIMCLKAFTDPSVASRYANIFSKATFNYHDFLSLMDASNS